MGAIKNKRKSKIDPAFYKVVRYYVTFIDDFAKSSGEGALNLPEDLIDKSLVENLDWQNFNEPMDGKSLFEFANKMELLEDKGLRLIIDFINSLEDSNKTLEFSFQMVESLPEEESRAFYLDALKSLSSHPNKNSTDFLSVPLSLLLRYMFIMLEGDPRETTEEDIEDFKKTNVMSPLISVLNLISTNLAYQRTMPQIAEDIRNGDDKSLFKALTINKSILFAEEVKNRFIQAQLAGDTEFFEELEIALARKPLKNPRLHGKTYSVLALFWYTGLYNLTYFELHSFLEFSGLVPPPYPGGRAFLTSLTCRKTT